MVRDRATLAQVLVMPIVQLLILSNAATFQVSDTPTYVVDFDRSSLSRGLVTRFRASGHFRVEEQSESLELANEALLRGDVTMVLTIPRDFESSIVRTGIAPVQLAVNAEKGSAAGIVQSYASSITAAYASELEASARGSRHDARGDAAAPRHTADRCAGAKLVQPGSGLPALHGPRHPGRAGDADRHAAERAEHRAREGAGHARAAQCHPHDPRPVHRRQAAAVLDAGDDQSRARIGWSACWCSVCR